MGSVELFASALLGGVTATQLAEWLRAKRSYRRAVLLIHAELNRNTLILAALQRDQVERSSPQWRGWFVQRDWEAHKPDVAAKWGRRHLDLWAKMSVYIDLERYSTARHPPSDIAARHLREAQLPLRDIVPPWRIRLARRLWPSNRRGSTRLAWIVVWPHKQENEIPEPSDFAFLGPTPPRPDGGSR